MNTIPPDVPCLPRVDAREDAVPPRPGWGGCLVWEQVEMPPGAFAALRGAPPADVPHVVEGSPRE
jgi:hypothetical protein